MPKSKAVSNSSHSIDLTEPQYYFNRELSWLEFNRRVLWEAQDDRTPLLERLKFLAIFSSNLDEFFMVRVAGLKQQVEAEVKTQTPDGRTPSDQLRDIHLILDPMVQDQHQCFATTLLPELKKEGIYFLDFEDLNEKQKNYYHNYFEEQVFPVLTPLAVDPGHPFPFISNQSLNLGILLKNEDRKKELFARVKVDLEPRFVPLPLDHKDHLKNAVWIGVPLEQIIAHNLSALFPGMVILECHPFRVTRNADLSVEEDEAEDLLLALEQELRKQRKGGSVVRLEVLKSMSVRMRDRLLQELEVEPQDVYSLAGILNLTDLFSVTGLPLAHLKAQPWSSVVPPSMNIFKEPTDTDPETWENGKDILAAIRRGDVLVHHPYHSFSATVQRFVTQAAHDPEVQAIKMTLYRTSGDSPIINALIDAAENGKQVVALVELKARFDEANNITWARKLEEAGVHVVYGLVGLKTHTKTILVVRKEENTIRLYVHIGTGNYNPKTAKLYTDLGFFSCDGRLGRDLIKLFNYLTGYARNQSFDRLLVAPLNLRNRMVEMIERERDLALSNQPGRIIAKMNSLVDPQIIKKLYEASQAGVQIDLIVRGMCCLRPGLKGVSDNIRVISVIGRFLEHSRIFYFGNNGDDEIYIGSADWMNRNLSRRVEAVVPIDPPNLKQELKELLDLFLNDQRQAWELQSDGQYIQRRPQPDADSRGIHQILMEQTLASVEPMAG
ncbi:MAG: hypothetical protein RLZZ435_645 [Cyanobacteriota bacterium]